MRVRTARNSFLTHRHFKAHDKHVAKCTFTCGTCGKTFTTSHPTTLIFTPLIRVYQEKVNNSSRKSKSMPWLHHSSPKPKRTLLPDDGYWRCMVLLSWWSPQANRSCYGDEDYGNHLQHSAAQAWPDMGKLSDRVAKAVLDQSLSHLFETQKLWWRYQRRVLCSFMLLVVLKRTISVVQKDDNTEELMKVDSIEVQCPENVVRKKRKTNGPWLCNKPNSK